MKALLVKMSSLGDVIHALPAVSDAADHGVELDWVVEEAYASIPRRHPGVRRVLPIAWRRWRKHLWSHRDALSGFIDTLRHDRYDIVVDAQGLAKSAVVAALARAPIKAGLDFRSAREGLAALAYDRRIEVPRGRHAVDRVRTLFASAFGYSLAGLPERFGLEVSPRVESRRCLLLHGTTWPTKHWPEPMWRDLARHLAALDLAVELPWGNPEERARAERIAEGLPGVRVLESETLEALGERIAGSAVAVGVDSGLAHLAGACGVPTVVIYGATGAALTGCRGPRVVNEQSSLSCSPCLSRDCRYRGAPQSWRDEAVHPPCYARVTPEHVREEVVKLMEGRSLPRGQQST